MRELCLIFALWVVGAFCVHIGAHVEGVHIVAVRDHLREEDTSSAIPSGHHDLVY